MGNFRTTRAWQRAHCLALHVYRSTTTFPNRERYGLTAQIRRAAVSVISNIAEGFGRKNDKELARFLSIARGSVRELESQFILSRDLGYLGRSDWRELDAEAQEVSRILNGLIQRIRNPIQANTTRAPSF
jgi:four helix bundle protein